MANNCLISFKSNIQNFTLPTQFTYPFYYQAHPLCVLAAQELQDYIISENNWNHIFWKSKKPNELPIGKMFGVLLVKSVKGEIGYLAAFSGKIGDKNIYPNFVPPVYDMLAADSFF